MSRQKSIFEELPAEPTEYQPATGAVTDEEQAAEAADAMPAVPALPPLVAVPPPPRPPFELELRRLVRRRLSGEVDFEEFCRLNLELHFRYGRSGYDLEQYERDVAEFRERERRAERRRQLEQTVRGKLELLDGPAAVVESSHAVGA